MAGPGELIAGASSADISWPFFEMPPRCNHRFSIAWVSVQLGRGVENEATVEQKSEPDCLVGLDDD
jgi:hypothetical protein